MEELNLLLTRGEQLVQARTSGQYCRPEKG
jgi:hypothetical protein